MCLFAPSYPSFSVRDCTLFAGSQVYEGHLHRFFQSCRLILCMLVQRVNGVLAKKAAHPMAESMSEILYLVTGFGSGLMSAMDHPKALGDVLESLVGGVLMDSGFDLAKVHQVPS